MYDKIGYTYIYKFMNNNKMDHERNLKRSFKLWIQNKYLWLVGAILAFFGGGGGGSRGNFNSGGGGGSSSSGSSSGLPTEMDEGMAQFIEKVESVPQETWMIMVLSCALILIIWILVSMYIRNVAKSGLLKASAEVHFGKKPGFGGTWKFGNQYWFKLVYQRFVLYFPMVIFQIIILIVAGFIAFSLVSNGVENAGNRIEDFFETGQIAIFILPFCLVMCILVIYSIIASMISPFSERKMIVDDIAPIPSIKEGFDLLKGNFSDIVIGYLITIAGGIVVAIPMFIITLVLIIPIGLVVMGVFLVNIIMGIIVGIILGLILGTLMAGLRGVILAYWYIFWTGLYLDLTGREVISLEQLEKM